MSDILFKNCSILDGRLRYNVKQCVGVTGNKIDHIGEYRQGSKAEYDCGGGILLPAFCNAHAHSAMTLLRGIGEDLPLEKWLQSKIFPAEAKLTAEDCYTGTVLACAEMLKYGTASCSDMYFFGASAVKAYTDVGFKANFAPNVTCFNDDSFEQLPVFAEYEELSEAVKGSELIKLDVALHAVYSTTPKVAEGAARYAADHGYSIHLHLSETKKEVDDCIALHGVTPAAYFESVGVFDVHTQAAHCVWLTDDDREIMRKKKVVAVSCPESNLKLGSGICDYNALKNSGVTCAVATDGDASNNNLNMLKEARLAALLAKGTSLDPSSFLAADALWSAHRAGYIAQGRYDSGYLNVGMSADLALFPAKDVNMIPNGDVSSALLYSSDGIADMTMVNGRILYDKGSYTTIDIEKVKADALQIRGRINGK